jgi:hypothetical protein
MSCATGRAHGKAAFLMHGEAILCHVLTVNFRQPSHEFTLNVGIDLLF